MGDVGDYWRDAKEHRTKQRDRFRAGASHAFDLLREAGLHPVPLSDEHYRIADEWDWWPSTGTWRNIRTGARGFRVRGLIKKIQERA